MPYTHVPQPPVVETGLSREGIDIVAGWDWPTIGLFLGCYAALAVGLMMPVSWVALSVPLLVLALTLHSSLSHEILHGHPFRTQWINCAMAMIQPGLFVPYLRFKRQHLAHHRDANLTDPYDDPETNFLDPGVWVTLPRALQWVYRFNNTLLGRMTLGPAIGMWAFVGRDLRAIRAGDLRVARDWLWHMPGAALIVWLVALSPLPLWIYLLACYGALSVLKIRTFLEHRAHERASGRSVIIEDRGLLAFLFLNNNLHAVHHMHPAVAWYRLPGLYARARGRYTSRNQGYVYRSYGAIFRQYFLQAKDPVAHPLWPPKR